MSDSITTAQVLRQIQECKRGDRYWWPRCFGQASNAGWIPPRIPGLPSAKEITMKRFQILTMAAVMSFAAACGKKDASLKIAGSDTMVQ